MAPSRSINDPSYAAEYNDFIAKLAAYHEKRGTHFEAEPRVGSKSIDLLYLYNTVVERGGYDKVSDEKLAWRKLGGEFNLGANNLPALAFSLKTTYYKFLAAYEISTIHGKEPPPKEILEETTAKGGALLTRTVENFRPSTRREPGALGNDNSDASGDEGTPSREINGSEEPPGSGGRVTRGLRQAPPQRVLFQPEAYSSRPSRHVSATSHPPNSQNQMNQHQHQQLRGASTSYNPSSNMDNLSTAVANYEPRPQMPLTLRPVITPGNNPVEYSRRQKALKEAQAIQSGRTLPPKGIVFPGTSFDGPNIYVRCLCALKSGIRSEQEYALHHLVKISMERGDKYKFESFPGLAEALLEKVLEVSSLFYQVQWEISYMDNERSSGQDSINGVTGTQNILERIEALSRLPVDDNIQTAEFSDALVQINEAALTIRNMVMLEENAYYVSDLSPLQDFLSIALNLPPLDSVTELKHYALDIAEQITKYLHLEQTDPLYRSLLAQLHLQDRGAILTALRAVSRISMNLEETNLLKGVPKELVQNIINWTLLNDEELAHACLDFLYQYTAVVENVEYMLKELNVEPLINQLTRLLMYGTKIIEKEYSLGRETRIPAPQDIAALPQELLIQLLKLEEPERSSQWLRCLFEEDRDESITQIALWQAYQNQFNPVVLHSAGALLPAADFIKNVSTTFAEKAAAQVQAGPVQKFIIKGIRRRTVPVDMKGEEFSRCKWRHEGSTSICGKFYMAANQMYQHILQEHLGGKQNEDGKFVNSNVGTYICQWEDCHRFRASPASKLSQIAAHVKVHLPTAQSVASKDSAEYSSQPPAKRMKPSYIVPPKKQAYKYQYTAQDERGEAAGIPLTAVLVLRNLARNLPKTEADEAAVKTGGVSHVEQLFKPVEPQLFEIMAHNKPLSIYLSDLIGAIWDP